MIPSSRCLAVRLLLVLWCVLVGWPACLLAQQTNVALGKPVSASGATWSGQVPENMTDGILANQTHPEASSGTLGFTYEVDLGKEFTLDRIELVNRTGCCPERLSNYRVSVFADGGGTPGTQNWSADIRTDGSHSGDGGRDVLQAALDPGGIFAGRYFHIVNLSNEPYNPQIAEIEVYESPVPVIGFFTTSSGNITKTGNPELPTFAELSWNVAGADTISISHLGEVAAAGSQVVSPNTTTTYVLTAANAAGNTLAGVTVGVDESALPPVLNEFMADNARTLDDQDGDSEDWLEIHNRNPFTLSLAGYYLTDDPDLPTKWQFPPGARVPANGFLVVFASDKDLTDPLEPLHTNFKLAKEGGYLALVAPDGATVIGQFPADFPATAQYPAQKEDRSYGLGADLGAGFFDPPTPGAPNGTSFAGFVEDTKFDLNRGIYRAPIAVAIATATSGASIRFTTDGSTPTETHGTLYTAPVAISTTTTLRARAYLDGLAPTNVDTHTYLYLDDVLASPVMRQTPTRELRNALTALPSLSIVTPNNINDSSEVETSFELILPDGSEGFQENCGIKRFGGAFTNFDKKNFRLYFRSRYGAAKLKYPLFEGFERGIAPPNEFDQLNLRSGSHDMVERGFYMSNRFTDDTMLDMGNINPHGRFMHLYLNGTYWGQYHVRERWNASTLSQYLGGPKEAYEAINGNWNVGGWADSVIDAYDGDGSAWERVKSLADDYEAIRPYNDVQHFVDYMLMFMLGNSEDEYRCVGPAGPGSGFKWFLNDADGYLRSAGNRTGFSNQIVGLPGGFGRSNGDGPGSIFSLLYKSGHPDYRILLADRIHKHFFNDGALTPARNIARLRERTIEVNESFRTEAIRWGYRTHESWTTEKDRMLNNIFPGRTAAVLANFRNAGFYPDLAAPVLNQHGGTVPAGFIMQMSAPRGEVYYTIDGSDPRLPGGALNPAALSYDGGLFDETVIPTGAVWKFLDDGSDQQTAWRDLDYNDSSWNSGPAELGYGEGDESTVVSYGPSATMRHITTYFRNSFELAAVDDLVSAVIQLKRDDGALVFLNGVEIARDNLTGGVDWQTLAARATDDGKNFHPFSVAPHHFRIGTNVIAVELHQESPNSSDLSFDFELTLTRSISGNNALSLTGNTLVRMRALDGTEWSALNEAFFNVQGVPRVAPGELAIAELHYHPAGAANTEFIELMNVSSQALNLRGVRFSDGIEFSFPDNRDTILVPGQRLLVVDSHFAMDEAYGLGLPIGGVYRGNLDNAGERVALEAPDGTTLLEFTYDDQSPWPESADGHGFSLTLASPRADPANPANWRPSTREGGTPGTGDGISFTGNPDEDLDGDGFTAFAEHALGTSDRDPTDARAAIQFGLDIEGRLTVSFPRNLAADDVREVIEVSTDLVTWTSGPDAAEFLSLVGNIATYRASASAFEEPAQFLRLRFLSRSR